MPRFHNINGNNVQFTAQEEAAWDLQEVEYANGADQRALDGLRQTRNNLLRSTDYLALTDVVLTPDMRDYRQALRDITNGLSTATDVANVTFPVKPV